MQNEEKFLTKDIRLYLAYTMTHRSNPSKNREIKCEKCNRYNNLEFHHKKYIRATIDDIKILCSKCHRNSPTNSQLATIVENGKRYCISSDFKFAY